jgi:hypothetical protein
MAAASAKLDATTLESAWKVTDWFAVEQMRLLSGMREDKRHGRCERLISILSREGKEKKMPRANLRDHHRFSEEELQALAKAYPSRLELGETLPGPNGGRPNKWIRAR